MTPKKEILTRQMLRQWGACSWALDFMDEIDVDSAPADEVIRLLRKHGRMKRFLPWLLGRWAQPLLTSGEKFNINLRDQDGETGLSWAVTAHKMNSLRFLLTHGACPNLRVYDEPLLNRAVDYWIEDGGAGLLEVLKLFVVAGAKVNARSCYDETALGRINYYFRFGHDLSSCVEYLKSIGAHL